MARSRCTRGRAMAVARVGVPAALRSSARKVGGSSARSTAPSASGAPRGTSTTRLSPSLSSSRPTWGMQPRVTVEGGIPPQIPWD